MEQFENPHLDSEIAHADRDKMKGFNTLSYWWIWWDEEKDLIINQFDRVVNKSGRKYLLGIGAIDKKGNRIFHMEE